MVNGHDGVRWIASESEWSTQNKIEYYPSVYHRFRTSSGVHLKKSSDILKNMMMCIDFFFIKKYLHIYLLIYWKVRASEGERERRKGRMLYLLIKLALQCRGLVQAKIRSRELLHTLPEGPKHLGAQLLSQEHQHHAGLEEDELGLTWSTDLEFWWPNDDLFNRTTLSVFEFTFYMSKRNNLFHEKNSCLITLSNYTNWE